MFRMDILYLGHSGFKFKGKDSIVVVDPVDISPTPTDVVILSDARQGVYSLSKVSGTPRRTEPYVVKAPGEYEVNGVGIFGWGSDHGENTAYSIIVDGVRIAHLGNLKEEANEDLVTGLGTVDVLLVPVGGGVTLGPKEAQIVIEKLSPSIVVPMCDTESGIGDFLKMMGITELAPIERLKVTKDSLPEGMQVVVLSRN